MEMEAVDAEKYTKLTPIEHILQLPDTYIGSATPEAQNAWVLSEERDGDGGGDGDGTARVSPFDEPALEPVGEPSVKPLVDAEGQRRIFSQQALVVNPGFFKLFDEAVVNAHDHVVRMRASDGKAVKHIDIEVQAMPPKITIRNDGDGIDVLQHPEHACWIPELIMGQLLTSTNYDPDAKRLTGGKNGYGIKLVNIFSRNFTLKTVDAKRQLRYEQTWTNNMRETSAAKVSPTKASAKPFVEVSWEPDLCRLVYGGSCGGGGGGGSAPEIPADMVRVFEKRAWDLAATVGKDVKVTWNGSHLEISSWAEYASMYLPRGAPVVAAKMGDRWEIAVADNPIAKQKLVAVSFVNGIPTTSGGTHVQAILSQTSAAFIEALRKRRAGEDRVETLVENSLAIFIKCLVENPTFSSQTKEALKTRPKDFGSSCDVPDTFLKKAVAQLGVLPKLMEALDGRDAKAAKKTDGAKTTAVRGVPKLSDAALAGTKDSIKCTLILTEGDSAKTMALSGLSSEQRRNWGVFPLRGKLINPKEAALAKVHANAEVEALKKILGLKVGATYTDARALRYGRIVVMTDQDLDGSHIRGLLLNLFHALWPQLLQVQGFLTFMATPLLKIVSGPHSGLAFYSAQGFRAWLADAEAEEPSLRARVKYYKGLGTSSASEAREYFSNPRLVNFSWTAASEDALRLAFDPSQAAGRKTWLSAYEPAREAVPAGGMLPIEDFVHKDLVHFSHYNLERAIPNLVDGLKVSQRKILFSCFKRNLVQELRVAQLAGYVSEHAAYHHGEASLCAAITAMAQTFVGANNIALLEPLGQFGSRLEGGSDAASPRYISTRLGRLAPLLFPPADTPVLQYARDDDDNAIEPLFYVPILPMVLINGAEGIGTGYSTSIPPHNPREVLCRVRARLEHAELMPWSPLPFWHAFTGNVAVNSEELLEAGESAASYKVSGTFERSADVITIQELPAGMWTSPYLAFLDTLVERGTLLRYEDASSDVRVSIRLHFPPSTAPDDEALHKLLKLSSRVKCTNMHLLDAQGAVVRFRNASDILEAYLPHRMDLYARRRTYMLSELEAQLQQASSEARFIALQISGTLDLRGREEVEICSELKEHGLSTSRGSYDYLLRMPLRSLTMAELARLQSTEACLQERRARLLAQTPVSMWLEELRVLEAAMMEESAPVHVQVEKTAGKKRMGAGEEGAEKKRKKEMGS
jgi:DNA topoisomerase-2